MWTSRLRGAAVGAAAAAVLVGAAGVGCESTGRTEAGEQAVESMADTRAEVEKAKGVVGDVQRSLEQLSGTANGGDVSAAYKGFTAAADELRERVTRARERALEMRDNGRAYMRSWESEMDRVSSPDIRSSAAERRAAVRANYDRIAAMARQARDAYQAYQKDLSDIRLALANDMTPAGVRSTQKVIGQAERHGQVLRQRLDELSEEIDRVYAGMAGRAPETQ